MLPCLLHSGSRLHDFLIGVTKVDLVTAPIPGNYPLCLGQYSGAATDGQILDLECDTGVSGRYVWIQILGTDEILTLCEVEVYEAGQLYQVVKSLSVLISTSQKCLILRYFRFYNLHDENPSLLYMYTKIIQNTCLHHQIFCKSPAILKINTIKYKI